MSEQPICPPEPRCPRCGRYANEDDADEHGHWVCRYCGFDPDNQDKCTVCGKPIPPKSENYGYSLCESCEKQDDKERWEHGEYAEYPDVPKEEAEEDLPRDIENELYDFEHGSEDEDTDKDLMQVCGDDSGRSDDW